MQNDDNAWFAPKRFGYGAGLPVAWQGWAVLGVYMLVLGSAARWLEHRSLAAFLIVAIGATSVLVVIAARKTRGGFRWRSGR